MCLEIWFRSTQLVQQEARGLQTVFRFEVDLCRHSNITRFVHVLCVGVAMFRLKKRPPFTKSKSALGHVASLIICKLTCKGNMIVDLYFLFVMCYYCQCQFYIYIYKYHWFHYLSNKYTPGIRSCCTILVDLLNDFIPCAFPIWIYSPSYKGCC